MDTSITMHPDADAKTLTEVVKLAEKLGFSDCYIADQGFSRDIYVTLAMLACATKRIHLGPGITQPYTRHPAATAIAIASLDNLSGGRAFLGLGAGGFRVLDPMRLKQARPMRACRETVDIARLLWRGGQVNYVGALFQLQEARLNFPCRSDIELHWAARGPKMLGLGGRLADVVMLFGIPRFELANAATNVRNGARAANRNVRMTYGVCIVYDDESKEHAREKTAYRLVGSQAHVQAQLGVSKELANQLSRLVVSQGLRSASRLVSDEILDHFILEGDVEDCASTLRSLIKAHSLTGITIELPDLLRAKTLLLRAAEIIARL